VIGGLWLAAVAPAYRVDLLHVVFMGGFTLLILAVGMRITLSHGGHALSAERRSWPLRVGIATGLFALLARIGGRLRPRVLLRPSRDRRPGVDRGDRALGSARRAAHQDPPPARGKE
jgi:uncharacterized protein involved in response to NO